MTAEANRSNSLDNDGFMQKDSGWSEEVARKLAEINEIGPLSDEHWRIIEFVREYYLKYKEGPAVVKIAKATGMTTRHVCDLFPCGIAKGAYRLAGLPRPSGCL